MIRKLLFAAAALILTAWASTADAIGNCTCTSCRTSTANCTVGGEIYSCQDYYAEFCQP